MESFAAIKSRYESTLFIISRERSLNIVIYSYDDQKQRVSPRWLIREKNKNKIEDLNAFEKLFYSLTWEDNRAYFSRFRFESKRVLTFEMEDGIPSCFTTINNIEMKLERIHICFKTNAIKPKITSFMLYGRDSHNEVQSELIKDCDFHLKEH